MVDSPYFAHGTILRYGNEEVDPEAETFTKVDRVGDFNVPRGQRDELEVTDHDSGGSEEFIAGLKRTGELSFDIRYLPQNASHQHLRELHDAGRTINWEVELPEPEGSVETAEVYGFAGWVRNFEIVNPVNGPRTANITIRITGTVESSLDAA